MHRPADTGLRHGPRTHRTAPDRRFRARVRTPLLADLRALLLELRYEGAPVMERVLNGREFYGTDAAPDLICVPRHGIDLKARFDRTAIFGHFGRFGMHTPDNAFFAADMTAAGTNMPKTADAARVRDVGGLVLLYFGLDDAQRRAHSMKGTDETWA